jgi:hypothetical protein
VLKLETDHGLAHAFRELASLDGVDVIEQHGELLAAVARNEILRPSDDRLTHLRHLSQRSIAGLVTIMVVVGFEVIDVEQRGSRCGDLRRRALPQPLEVLVEHAPVLHPGQRVALRELRHLVGREKAPACRLLECPRDDSARACHDQQQAARP